MFCPVFCLGVLPSVLPLPPMLPEPSYPNVTPNVPITSNVTPQPRYLLPPNMIPEPRYPQCHSRAAFPKCYPECCPQAATPPILDDDDATTTRTTMTTTRRRGDDDDDEARCRIGAGCESARRLWTGERSERGSGTMDKRTLILLSTHMFTHRHTSSTFCI